MGQTLSCVFVLSPFSELQVGCGKKARGGQGWGLGAPELPHSSFSAHAEAPCPTGRRMLHPRGPGPGSQSLHGTCGVGS